MTKTHDTVFLFDVDNTLLDNDRVQADLSEHLAKAYGVAARDRYWQIFEDLRGELGYADYLGALERYRIEVGRNHEVTPGEIVGAIANEAGLEGRYIGHIDIHEDFSLVDLPEGMPKEIFHHLRKVRVCGQPLQITLDGGRPPRRGAKPAKGKPTAGKGKGSKKRGGSDHKQQQENV